MEAHEREKFLDHYEVARVDGDVEKLRPFLSHGFVLEDPQLPLGSGDRELFLRLTRELSVSVAKLEVRRNGPVCVSADETCFTQRWFAGGVLADDPASRVAFETTEIYTAAGSQVERIAIFVRDMKQHREGLPRESGRAM